MHGHPPQHPPADPSQLDDDTLDFASKVFQLARAGDTAELAALLSQGLPPNLRNERGDSLLMLASYNGHPDTTRLLLEHGADPELLNDAGQSPLMGSAFKGNTAIAAILLDGGAQPDGPGRDGKTPLMFAAMFNRVELVQLLLARGADHRARDASGVSAADAARNMGAVDTAALLDALPK